MNAYFNAVGLRFENVNRIYFKITVGEKSLSRLSVELYREDETVPYITVQGKDLILSESGVYVCYTEDITAASFGTKYTAVIVYNGIITQSATYSVNSYVYAKQDEKKPIGALVRALYNYGKSAVAYINE